MLCSNFYAAFCALSMEDFIVFASLNFGFSLIIKGFNIGQARFADM